jgi:hypothetical protein
MLLYKGSSELSWLNFTAYVPCYYVDTALTTTVTALRILSLLYVYYHCCWTTIGLVAALRHLLLLLVHT